MTLTCFGCERPGKVHLYFEDDKILCRNCWSTRILTTVETSVVKRNDGSTRVLTRITRGYVPVFNEVQEEENVKVYRGVA